jgi:CRISPR/Cas system CSM-associated protein Csm3 (group 7 of RAMP superfamily)
MPIITKIEFDLFITLLSQSHVGTGFGMGKFIDKTTSKDKIGAIYIPGSTIKGKAKYFGRQIAMSLGVDCCREDKPCKVKPCATCRTFGSPLHQGKFFFSDAKIDQRFIKVIREEEQENPAIPMRFLLNTRTGTKIDRRSRTVQEDYLFTIESSVRGITLTSKIYGAGNDFIFKDYERIPYELLFLLSSLKLITHLGGGSSRGLGRVKIEIGEIHINGEVVEGI